MPVILFATVIKISVDEEFGVLMAVNINTVVF